MLEQKYCGWNSQEFMTWSKSRRQRDMHEFLELQSHHQWHTYSSKATSLNSSKQFHQLGTEYSNMNLWGYCHISHNRFTVHWTRNLLYYSYGMLNNQNTLSGLQEKCPWTKVGDVKRVGMSYSFFHKALSLQSPIMETTLLLWSQGSTSSVCFLWLLWWTVLGWLFIDTYLKVMKSES